MRKKLLTKTYLKGVSEYELIFLINDNKDFYKSIKKIKNKWAIYIAKDKCLIDDGYIKSS